jgi:2,3-bisphosphoglycerate-independent phosphoglycerate mutase
VGDVWCYVLADNVTKLKSDCGLNNVAATVLEVMGLELPREMDSSLIKE